MSNAVGGIAVQTVFLAVADVVYREVNPEHASASVANLAQETLPISPLAIPLLAMMLLTSILLMGLLRRERRGIANIGFESFPILVPNAVSFVLPAFGR